MKKSIIAGIILGIVVIILIAITKVPGQVSLIDQLMNPHPSTIVYEINNLYDLCLNKNKVFGGPESRNYYNKLRDYAASDPRDPLSPSGQLGMDSMIYEQKLSKQHVEDLMWNYKINPELKEVISNHIRGGGTPFVENIPTGGSRAVPCEKFLP